MGEANDAVNCTEFETTSNPSDAFKEVRFVGRGSFNPALHDERFGNAEEGKAKVDGLVSGEESKGKAGKECPEGLVVLIAKADGQDNFASVGIAEQGIADTEEGGDFIKGDDGGYKDSEEHL